MKNIDIKKYKILVRHSWDDVNFALVCLNYLKQLENLKAKRDYTRKLFDINNLLIVSKFSWEYIIKIYTGINFSFISYDYLITGYHMGYAWGNIFELFKVINDDIFNKKYNLWWR